MIIDHYFLFIKPVRLVVFSRALFFLYHASVCFLITIFQILFEYLLELY